MDAPHREAIRIVNKYLYSMPTITAWRGYSNKQISYSKWAAKMLLRELRIKCEIPPLIIMEEFKQKMDEYACLNPNTSYIFSVAYDTVECILDQLL